GRRGRTAQRPGRSAARRQRPFPIPVPGRSVMFEKIGRLAEAVATRVSVSRRGFLGRLGQGALAAAGVLGGLLCLPKDARAAGGELCCHYDCSSPYKGLNVVKRACSSDGTFFGCPPFFNCRVRSTTV